jgi:hypothetical protein
LPLQNFRALLSYLFLVYHFTTKTVNRFAQTIEIIYCHINALQSPGNENLAVVFQTLYNT